MNSKTVGIEQMRARVANSCMEVIDGLPREQMAKAFDEPKWFKVTFGAMFSRSVGKGYPAEPKRMKASPTGKPGR
jgi:hypothetical protein